MTPATTPTRAPSSGLSRFLDRWCEDHPQRLAELQAGERLTGPAAAVAAPPRRDDSMDFDAALRAYRDESLAVIAWRDLAGVDTLEATLAALSALADCCIEAALGHAEALVAEH